MTSTRRGSRTAKESSFEGLTGDAQTSEPGPKDDALQALEKQLSDAKDARLEERFIWIVVVVMLVDVLWFRNASNAVVPIVILVLQSVALFILANRMGVDEAKGLFERLIQSLSKGNGG